VDLDLHLIKVLGSKLTAQPNPRSALTTSPFNLESHASLVRGTLLRMQQLGHSQFLAGRGLEAPAMLDFEQMLFSEQTRRDCRVDRDQFDR